MGQLFKPLLFFDIESGNLVNDLFIKIRHRASGLFKRKCKKRSNLSTPELFIFYIKNIENNIDIIYVGENSIVSFFNCNGYGS